MDKYTDLPKQEKKIDYWRTQMTAYAQSDLSIRKFCQKQKLPTSQFQYWLYKIRNLDDGAKRKPTKTKKLIPINLLDDATNSKTRKIQFNWQNGMFNLECSGLTNSQIPELIKLIGDWYAQSNNNT